MLAGNLLGYDVALTFGSGNEATHLHRWLSRTGRNAKYCKGAGSQVDESAGDGQCQARVAAGQIVRLFAGGKPTDISFVQPTKFQLIANPKAAQPIALTLPPSLLFQADEVIE